MTNGWRRDERGEGTESGMKAIASAPAAAGALLSPLAHCGRHDTRMEDQTD